MDRTALKNVVTSKVARQVLLGKKHSPAILFAGGVIGVVATTVLACRATLKVDEILEEAEEKFAATRELKHFNYSNRDRKKDQAYISTRTTIKIAKLYAPAVVVGGLSIAALTGSHVVLTRRNTGLMSAYAALDQGYKAYQQRVREELGDEKELEIRRNLEEVRVDDTKKGEVKNVKRVREGGPHSPYARLFDRNTSQSWQPQADYNLLFLSANQRYANERLHAKGYVLLNDVYDSLGLDRTKEGCVTGWVKGNGGDDYIDFGIFRDDGMFEIHDFMTAKDGAIWLDFNVDGSIYHLI